MVIMKRIAFSSTGRFVLSLIALQSDHHGVVFSSGSSSDCCRSNATHIVWKEASASTTAPVQDNSNSYKQAFVVGGRETTATTTTTIQDERRHHQQLPTLCSIQTRREAERECMNFLRGNVMAFDGPFRGTMGFPDDDADADEFTADGLDYGLVGPTITLALDAKVAYPWTDGLPKDVFMDYVLNYANLNEARTNWRPLLVDALKFNESDLWRNQGEGADVSSVTTWVNTHLWARLGRGGEPIYFKSRQTPLIFDPMSIVAFGYASCTGTSILFCNALRSVGIAARVAGTPAWYGNRTQGNHNWVEVWDNGKGSGGGGRWKFLEPSPALPTVDTLDADPCRRWFCDPSRYPASRVYAAKLSKAKTAPAAATPASVVDGSEDCDCGHFPLAWEWDCRDVPAVDRTDYYAKICGSCGSEESDMLEKESI
jgi:Transglutaminase-like superfamily